MTQIRIRTVLAAMCVAIVLSLPLEAEESIQYLSFEARAVRQESIAKELKGLFGPIDSSSLRMYAFSVNAVPLLTRANNPPKDKLRKVTMQEWEMSKTGYAALHWTGWDARRLKQEADRQEMSQEALFRWHKDEKRFAQYMSEMFDNGATVMVIYGAFQSRGGYAMDFAPENETKAMIKWLRQSRSQQSPAGDDLKAAPEEYLQGDEI
jgi:hypothetical protein